MRSYSLSVKSLLDAEAAQATARAGISEFTRGKEIFAVFIVIASAPEIRSR